MKKREERRKKLQFLTTSSSSNDDDDNGSCMYMKVFREKARKSFFPRSIAKKFGLKNLILLLSSNLYSFHVVDKSEQNLRLNSTSEKSIAHNETKPYTPLCSNLTPYECSRARRQWQAHTICIWRWHEWMNDFSMLNAHFHFCRFSLLYYHTSSYCRQCSGWQKTAFVLALCQK